MVHLTVPTKDQTLLHASNVYLASDHLRPSATVVCIASSREVWTVPTHRRFPTTPFSKPTPSLVDSQTSNNLDETATSSPTPHLLACSLAHLRPQVVVSRQAYCGSQTDVTGPLPAYLGTYLPALLGFLGTIQANRVCISVHAQSLRRAPSLKHGALASLSVRESRYALRVCHLESQIAVFICLTILVPEVEPITIGEVGDGTEERRGDGLGCVWCFRRCEYIYIYICF